MQNKGEIVVERGYILYSNPGLHLRIYIYTSILKIWKKLSILE
jgi:hypothetical protein